MDEKRYNPKMGDVLRYLFLTADEYPSFRPELEILVGKYLIKRGHEIEWIMPASSSDTPPGPVEWNGSRVWLARSNPGEGTLDKIVKHLYSMRNDFRVFALARSGNYDFIQVKDKFVAALMALLAAKKHNLRFIYWLSFPYPEASKIKAGLSDARYPRFFFLRGVLLDFLLYKIICPHADHIIVQSDEMKHQMSLRGVCPEKMTSLPMGVDDEYLSIDPAKGKCLPRSIVYLGAFNRMRKLDFLLEAFSKVSRENPDIQLIMIGGSDDPADQAFLEARAKHLNILDRIRFTGFLPREEAFGIVSRASLCVSPIPPGPVYDVSSPTKTLEYLALGRPVVANDIPDTRDVIEGSEGGICTPYDIDAFANGIIWLLDHPDDAEKMGRRGKDYIRNNRTYSVLAERLEKVYETVFQDNE